MEHDQIVIPAQAGIQSFYQLISWLLVVGFQLSVAGLYVNLKTGN